MKRTTLLLVTLFMVVSLPLAAWAHQATHNHGCVPHARTIDGFRSSHAVQLGQTFWGTWREYHYHYSMDNTGQWVLQHSAVVSVC